MFKKISILLLLLFFVKNSVFAYSEDILNQIEYIKYGTAFSQESLSTRLNRLETDCFGMSQSGDLDTRIENLSKIITAGRYKNFQPYTSKESSKKNLFQKVWDDISSFMSLPYVTGYSPSIFEDDTIYSNDLYNREYMKMKNNFYCPSNSVYEENHHNYNKYLKNRNNLSSYNPYMSVNPYNQNHIYNPYLPTDSYKGFSTGSTVHILKD